MDLPHDIILSLKEQMKTPLGTVHFIYNSPDLTNNKVKGGRIFENVAGNHIFLLERTDDLILNYFYSSPGAGTSVASVDLNLLPKFTEVFICFTWSPQEITLSLSSKEISNSQLVHAVGKESNRQIRVGDDGLIYVINNENCEVKELTIFNNDCAVLTSTALEAWNNIKEAIKILGTSKSEMGYIHECVVSNLSLSILVTGFESYLKKRFLELEEEGIRPRIEDLLDSVFSSKEKHQNNLLIEEAKNNNISIIKYIVKNRRINFQNFDEIKSAYKKTYNLTLASANIDSKLIVPIKKFLRFRHKIIHVSPMLGLLNQEKIAEEEPVFANETLKNDALKIFDEFIQRFHDSTLKLRQ